MKFTILVDPTLVIIIISYFVRTMPLSREEDFKKKYINFTPKLPPLWVGGHEIYNFLSPNPTDDTWLLR